MCFWQLYTGSMEAPKTSNENIFKCSVILGAVKKKWSHVCLQFKCSSKCCLTDQVTSTFEEFVKLLQRSRKEEEKKNDLKTMTESRIHKAWRMCDNSKENTLLKYKVLLCSSSCPQKQEMQVKKKSYYLVQICEIQPRRRKEVQEELVTESERYRWEKRTMRKN